MDPEYFRGSLAQQNPPDNDYFPEWLDPNISLDGLEEQSISAGQFVPVMRMAENFTSCQKPEIPQALGSQEHNYGDFQQKDPREPASGYPGLPCYVHDLHLQNNTTFILNSSLEAYMPRVPSVAPADYYKPLPIHSEYSPYDPVGRNATDLPANPISSELSKDILVQPRADQQVLNHCNELGLPAPEHTTSCGPTKGFLSPPRVSRPAVSSGGDTGSRLGGSIESSGSMGGESREIIWDLKTGNEVQAKGVKHRSEEEKENKKRLRAQGGACEECRRGHRKCNHRSGETPEAAKVRQPPSFRTSSRNPAIRNLETGNLTHSLPGQIPSSRRLLSPTNKQDNRPGATDSPIAQTGNMEFHTSEIDEFRNTGSQFASVQYPILPQSLEGENWSEVSVTAAGELPQNQYNALQLQGHYHQNVRRQHNMGSNPRPYPSYLLDQGIADAIRNESGLSYCREAPTFPIPAPANEWRIEPGQNRIILPTKRKRPVASSSNS